VLVAFGVGYIEHNVTLRHADDDKTLLAIIFPIINTLKGKHIVEHRSCQIEAYAMRLQVGLGFGVVPFKLQSP